MPPPAATDIVRYRATTAEGRFVLAWKFVQDAPGSSGWRLFGSPPCLRISVSIAPSSWRRTLFTETAPIFQPSKTEAGKVPLTLAVRSIFGPLDPYSGYTHQRESPALPRFGDDPFNPAPLRTRQGLYCNPRRPIWRLRCNLRPPPRARGGDAALDAPLQQRGASCAYAWPRTF